MSDKKCTATKGELSEFNRIWKDAKVKGLGQEATRDYLYLKIKISEIIKDLEQTVSEGSKTVLCELGYKEGDSIPKDKVQEINSKVFDVISKLYDEEVQIDTHILSADDLYNCLLNIEENNSINTEGKAILMKCLAKS